MALNPQIGLGITGLLLSTFEKFERLTFVQSRPHVTVIRSVADLYTETFVPKVGTCTHTFRVASQQLTLTHIPFDLRTPLDVHFTVIHSPQTAIAKTLVKNLTLQKYVADEDVSWFGNILVFAHLPGGKPVPFSGVYIEDFRVVLSRLLKLRFVRDAMKFAHWRMSRQTSPALPMYEPQIGAQAPVPDEVLRYIMVLSDAHTLAMLNRVSAGMRSVVKTSFTVTVRNALLPFLPAHKLQGFFDCLTECRGVIFGDVALRVQTRARWTLSGMSIAVARGNAIPMVGWLTTCGYVKRPVSRPQNWGTHYIYGIQHEVIPDRWIYVYESDDEFTVTPVLSCKSSARMTMLTAHALVSVYTKLTENRMCITSTALDLLHYQALGFRVFLEGRSMPFPCGIYCPRKRRSLHSGQGVDLVAWGGLQGIHAVPDAELAIFRDELFWMLGHTCHNVRCGRQGTDQNVVTF